MIQMKHVQIQKQTLSPVMQQSIEVLLLPIMDLNAAIAQELQDNPLLELIEEHKETPEQILEREYTHQVEKINHIPANSFAEFYSDDEVIEDRPHKTSVSLEEKLMRQLRMEFSDPISIQIGEFILGNLDEDGYLTCNRLEIAENTDTDDFDKIEEVLKIIQEFEPLGIASRDLKECLSVQAKFRCPEHIKAHVEVIIQHYLGELGRKKYNAIAKELKISLERVKEAARVIATLDPKPARNDRPIDPCIYIKPDIAIVKDASDDLKVQVNQDYIPALRVNTHYKTLLNKPHLKTEEKEFIREKMRNAVTFIKSVEQRGNTIHRIAEYILEKQKSFFNNEQSTLVPMNLKDVAEVLERNESTISRAINNKYVETPQGLFPLKYFFSQGINKENSDQVAANSIKEAIKDLMDEEDKTSPLSDQDIQRHFEKKGYSIARRTVTKYRKALRILPSYLRKI